MEKESTTGMGFVSCTKKNKIFDMEKESTTGMGLKDFLQAYPYRSFERFDAPITSKGAGNSNYSKYKAFDSTYGTQKRKEISKRRKSNKNKKTHR